MRALRYYLDRTKDLRAGKDLVFVSFRKSFQKDIVPATVSSWIKQTVLLCYQLSDHEAQTIHQVRAHDVRAFAASKAFQGGVSLDQILSACHLEGPQHFYTILPERSSLGRFRTVPSRSCGSCSADPRG